MTLKRIGFFVILIISVLIINNLVHSIYNLWQKQELLVRAQQQLIQVKKQNQALKKQLTIVNQPQFLEEQARDKLFLAKPNEGIVIIPQQYSKPSPVAMPQHQDTRPNWQKWWEEFF